MKIIKLIHKNISFLLIVSIMSLNFSIFFSYPITTNAVPNPATSYCSLILGNGYCINAASDLNASNYYLVTAGIDIFTDLTNNLLLEGTTSVIPVSTVAGTAEQTAQNLWTTIGLPFLEGLFKTFGLLLINELTAATVDWINSGFNGNPAFISDPGRFSASIADKTIGAMIENEPALSFLCQPFQNQIKLALAVNFGPTFQSKITCTLSNISQNLANNYQTFLSDVRNQNWKTWLTITTQPENNALGAYLMTQEQLSVNILNQKMTFANQLNMGNGALNYEKCTETRYQNVLTTSGPDKGKYKVVSDPKYSKESEGNQFLNSLTLKSTVSDGYMYTKDCKITTPGNTISALLGEKANSTQTMSQLAVATGNGVDAVLNALLSKLIQTGIDALKKGMLSGGTNSPEYNKYVADMNEIARNSKSKYNQSASAPADESPSFSSFKNTASLYDEEFITASSSTPFSEDIIQPSEYNKSTGNISSSEKSNAFTAINYYLKSEQTYQNTLLEASTTLTTAQNIFVTARNCNVSYNSINTTLRANLINSNVIKNIDGTPISDSYRTLAQIPWNLATTTKLLDISNANIKILNNAMSSVNIATSSTGIRDAMIPVNSTSFNTDPQKSMIVNIKTWLKGVQGMYSTKQCPINLDVVLATSTSATSTKTN